jgi:hypothetical protein
MTASVGNGAALVKSPQRRREGDDAIEGRDYGGGAVVDAELGEHVQQVGLDRPADEQGGVRCRAF